MGKLHHLYVSATVIAIETRDNVLRNRKPKWLVLFFGLSLLPSDELGTAFTNESAFRPTSGDQLGYTFGTLDIALRLSVFT